MTQPVLFVMMVGLFSLLSCVSIMHSYALISVALTLRPLIDLAWHWEIGNVLGQRLNPQTLVATWVLVVGALRAIFKRRFLWKREFSLLILIVLCSLILNAFMGDLRVQLAINDLIRIVTPLAIYSFAGVAIRDFSGFAVFARRYLAVVMVPTSLAYLQAAGILPFQYYDWNGAERVGRASGTYPHPLNLVSYITLTVPLVLLSYFSSKSIAQKTMHCVILFVTLGALVLTYHRTGLIAVAVEVIVFFVLQKRYRMAVALTVLGVIVGFVLFRQPEFSWMWASVVSVVNGDVEIFDREFLRGRGIVWGLFLSKFISADPSRLLLGFGAPFAEGFVSGFGYFSSQEPHSDFLRILYSYGLSGLIVYIWILIALCKSALLFKKVHGDVTRSIADVFLAYSCAFIILSLTTEPMRYPAFSSYLFGLASVVHGCYIRRRQEVYYDEALPTGDRSWIRSRKAHG